MAYLEIRQTGPLSGTYRVQGSKNAVLPMLAATLLVPGKTILRRVPQIRDVNVMLELLRLLGCSCVWTDEELIIDAGNINNWEIPKELIGKMRSSVMLLAPILYRMKKAAVVEPGGCSIGRRPIDIHLYVLESLGVKFSYEDKMNEEKGDQVAGLEHTDIGIVQKERRNERILAKTNGFWGAILNLKFPSVGATEQAILAAVVAEGTTVIKNAAREPEITELCQMLRGMGAKITGDQTGCIVIDGVKTLCESVYEVGADRIVAATCLSAVAVCAGEITLTQIKTSYLDGVTDVFEKLGCHITTDKDTLTARRSSPLKSVSFLKTSPYPGFPTDVQSLVMAVLSFADGKSVVEEGIFEGRFRTAYQLQKMGAEIIIKDNQAIIWGSQLHGAEVEAPDLRGGAALAAAGLGADGVTRVYGYEHIARGYEDLAGMLRALGAQAYLRE